MEVSNFWVSLIFSGEVDCRLLKTLNIPLIPLAGEMVIPLIRTGELCRGDLTSMLQSPGVLTYLPIRIKYLGVWLTRALLRAASVMTYFVIGVASV